MYWFSRVFKLIVFLLIIFVISHYAIVFLDSLLLGDRAPYFQQQTDNSIIIRWQSDHHAMGVVRYGEQPDYLESLKLEESAVKKHSIKILGLKPDTRYYYKAGDIDGFIEGNHHKNWFRTAPLPGTRRATRIWVIGDSGVPGKTARQVRNAMYQWVYKHPRKGLPPADVWLGLGDFAYPSGTNDQFQAALFDTYPDLLSNTVLWPVYGNHDARRWTYFKLFDLPEKAEAGGVASHTENYYAFDYGDSHFVMLDSTASSMKPGSDMLNWLQRDLAHNKRSWVIAALHHPPYTKGSHDSDKPHDSGGRMIKVREHILPILEKAGVDVVLAGHSHDYERSYLLDCAYRSSKFFSQKNIVSHGIHGKNHDFIKPAGNVPHQGAIYVVAGSSSQVGQGPLNHPANVVGLKQAGSLIIDINGNTLVGHFINNRGKEMDTFSIRKQAGYKSGYAGCR